MTKRQYFGTDGIRSKVGSATMEPVFLLKLGFAIGSILRQRQASKTPKILIGHDTRISGEMLQSALVSGLLAAGCDVLLGGVLPTPVIAFLTKHSSADAGLIISASHNPYQDNGVKCINAEGMKVSDDWELAVEHKIQQPIEIVPQRELGSIQIFDDPIAQYIAHCKKQFAPALDLSPYSIILDCANGATAPLAVQLFRQFGATVKAIHDAPSGININDECGATHLASLQKTVLADKADCGLAFDGDGDRLIMVDHQGEIVDGDQMLGIIALHGNFKGVVGTLMTNLGLEKALEDKDIAFERAAVGDRYVLSALLEKNWKLGGEASGHIINLNYAQTGDGMISGLQILKIMHETGQSLHALKQCVKKRPQILINVPIENPKQFSDKEAINSAVAKAQAELGQGGRVLLRASGTESCVRVMVECDHAEQGQEIAQSLADVVTHSFLEFS